MRTGVIAGLVGGIPLFAVLYWLAIEQGSWLRVLVVHVAVIGIAVILWLRFKAGYVSVVDGTITKVPFSSKRVVRVADVASVVIVQTHGPSAHDLVPQLVALGFDGTPVFRMRGIYWELADMKTVADAIGCPVTVLSESMTSKEFYAAYPGVAYWYEGRVWLSSVGIVVALGVAFVTMSWLMSAIGVPSVLSLPF